MQSVTAFVFVFSLQIFSLAQEVIAYPNDGYRNEKLNGAKSQLPWEFVYDSTLHSHADIYVNFESPNVTVINITYYTDAGAINAEMYPTDKDGIIITKPNFTKNEGEKEKERYVSSLVLNSTEIKVELHFYKSNKKYSEVLAHGWNISKIPKEEIDKSQSRLDYAMDYYKLKLVIDFKNECLETTKEGQDNHTSDNDNMVKKYCVTIPNNVSTKLPIYMTTRNESAIVPVTNNPNAVLMYAIPPVIAICVIILVTYICIIKCRHTHTYVPPDNILQATKELCVPVTANEVLYADLSLAPGDSQPARCEKEPTYAEIVGVLKPADENI